MYNREKRRFAKLILDQYKKLGRDEGNTRYCQENRRLRDYAEALFLGLRQKRATLITPEDVQVAMTLLDIPEDHCQQMQYVAELAIGAITGANPRDFVGEFKCGNCGGKYKQAQVKGYIGYRCDTCFCEGRADQHGFPISLPANRTVRSLRRKFHENIKTIGEFGVIPEEAYMLVAYEGQLSLPDVHAGLCTTQAAINKLINASKMVLQKLSLERAV